jgi:hypothetical protein
MATTHTLSWKKSDDADDDELVVWVDVAKLDDCWRSNPTTEYLAQGNGDWNTFHYLREATRDNALMRMPRLAFSETRYPKLQIGFRDGRHRFAFVRDHGGRAMPVTISRDDIVAARLLFGSDVKACDVNL